MMTRTIRSRLAAIANAFAVVTGFAAQIVPSADTQDAEVARRMITYCGPC